MTLNRPSPRDAADITEAIRAEIVHGIVPTGSEIVIADLSEALDATMSDVRQALVRLMDQHLVVTSGNGAFQVVATSPQDLRELTTMRQLLEGEAVRLAVERHDAEWAEHLQAAFHELDAAGAVVVNPGLDTRWRIAHTSFHEALCAGCDNRRLLTTVGSLRDEAEIYRELSAAAMTDERRDAVDREHRELLELALVRDSERAAAKLRVHLEGTMRTVGDRALEREDR